MLDTDSIAKFILVSGGFFFSDLAFFKVFSFNLLVISRLLKGLYKIG